MDCSTPVFPFLHHLLEFAQVHVYCIGDAVQPSHPLMPPSPSALNLSQHQDFSNEWSVHIRWPKYWCFSFSISPSSEYSGLSPLRLTGLISLLSKGLSGVFSSTTVRRHQFFGALPSLQSSCHNRMWPLGRPQRWLYKPLSAEECLCFTTHCLGLSWLFCQEAIAFWFHGCSHHL